MHNCRPTVFSMFCFFSLLIHCGPAVANEDKKSELVLEAGGYPVSMDPSKPGAGKFEFIDSKGNPDKPIMVWYYRPENLPEDHLVVFVMHGGRRNGQAYRYPWIDHAIAHKFLLLVPEFSREYYPDNFHYNYGNMVTRSWEPVDESKWTFTAMEHLFDYSREKFGFKREAYCIYGHSAGAQFIHRMILFKPGARIERAIAANSGWYTLPVFEEAFPAGLKGSTATRETQKMSLKKKLIVLLGDLDTNDKDPNLPGKWGAKAQGKHRFERGHTLFRIVREESSRINMPLAWELRIVKGVGHSHFDMAEPAAAVLAENAPETGGKK